MMMRMIMENSEMTGNIVVACHISHWQPWLAAVLSVLPVSIGSGGLVVLVAVITSRSYDVKATSINWSMCKSKKTQQTGRCPAI